MFGHVNSDTSKRGRYFLFYAYHGISGVSCVVVCCVCREVCVVVQPHDTRQAPGGCTCLKGSFPDRPVGGSGTCGSLQLVVSCDTAMTPQQRYSTTDCLWSLLLASCPNISQTLGLTAGISGGAVLAALVAGDAAIALEQLPHKAAVADVMGLLRSIFKPQGVTVPEPLQVRWQGGELVGAGVAGSAEPCVMDVCVCIEGAAAVTLPKGVLAPEQAAAACRCRVPSGETTGCVCCCTCVCVCVAQAVVTRWGSDPMAYGSYSSVAVGSANPADYEVMARPVGGRLFFAGEATSTW